MLLAGVPGQGALNVFKDNLIISKPGSPSAAIVDPLSANMVSNLLSWPSNKILTSQSGAIFISCNIAAFRSLMKNPGAVNLTIITPPIGPGTDEITQFYWLVTSNTVDFTPTVNPLFPTIGTHAVDAIFSDSPGQPGSANKVIAIQVGNPPAQPGETIFDYNARVFGGPPFFPIAQASGNVHTDDTTAWGVQAAIWQKQKTFSQIIQTGIDGTWPQGPPVPQPTSRVFDGAAAAPLPSVAEQLSVSIAPGNTVTMHR